MRRHFKNGMTELEQLTPVGFVSLRAEARRSMGDGAAGVNSM